MVLNTPVDSICHYQKSAGTKGLIEQTSHGKSVSRYLDNIVFLFRKQVLFVFIPADTGLDDAAQDVLIAGNT